MNIIEPLCRNRKPTIHAMDPIERLREDILCLPEVDYKCHYIYFLLDDYCILYIGRTNNPIGRVKRHKKEKRIPFTEARYAYMDSEEQSKKVEAFLIQRLQPIYNTDYLQQEREQ